jgi:hypothetical protein
MWLVSIRKIEWIVPIYSMEEKCTKGKESFVYFGDGGFANFLIVRVLVERKNK